MFKTESVKKIILILLVCILAAIVGGYFYLYQEHRDISSEKAIFQLEAAKLLEDFTKEADASNSKYLNQTIEVNGTVTELTDSSLVLDPGVFCSFTVKTNPKWKGREITVKGRCIGYDELFSEIKLDQCTVK